MTALGLILLWLAIGLASYAIQRPRLAHRLWCPDDRAADLVVAVVIILFGPIGAINAARRKTWISRKL